MKLGKIELDEDALDLLEKLIEALNNHSDALRRSAKGKMTVVNNPAPVHVDSVFPYETGDVIVLGPEIFANTEDPTAQTVISWKGMNFVPQGALAGNPEKSVQEKLDALGKSGDQVGWITADDPVHPANDHLATSEVKGDG